MISVQAILCPTLSILNKEHFWDVKIRLINPTDLRPKNHNFHWENGKSREINIFFFFCHEWLTILSLQIMSIFLNNPPSNISTEQFFNKLFTDRPKIDEKVLLYVFCHTKNVLWYKNKKKERLQKYLFDFVQVAFLQHNDKNHTVAVES